MTVIPDLEKQLVRAAARASAAPVRSRRRLRLTIASAATVALVVLVVATVDLGGGSGSANAAARVLEQAAQKAAGGLGAPRLHPGQAWFTSELGMNAAPWERVPSGQPTVLPSSRAITEQRYRSENWTFYDGGGRTQSEQLGVQFFGSASDRSRWLAKGRYPEVILATSGVRMSNGFSVGTKALSYRQVLQFPTEPAAVLKFLTATEPGGSDTLDAAASVLTQVPLLPAARAAVFRALAKATGVRYLGHARDPLGRLGVAVAVDRTFASVHLRSELIFNPQTAGLLAQETLLLDPPRIPGVRAPFATSWTAYLTSSVVPQSSAPTLKQLGLPPPPRQPLPPPPVTSAPVGSPEATATTASAAPTP